MKPIKGKSAKTVRYTPKEKIFCSEYIIDWNCTRAYFKAYPNTKNENVAAVCGNRMLRKPKIKNYIEEIQKDLEKTAGISRLRVLQEHKKIAFTSIAHLHNTWIERTSFELLTEEQKSCISEISTQVRTINIPGSEVTQEVEFVKIKLYDKQKALDSITRMLGYDSPVKQELTGKDGKELIPARVLNPKEAKEYIQMLKDEY